MVSKPMNHDHQLLSRYGFFRRLERHLASVERFHLPIDLESFVKGTVEFVFKNRSKRLAAGYKMYRARVSATPGENGYEKFGPKEMGAPPANLASAGRLNSRGIPFLYTASDAATAIAEVRPWTGAHVTVAELTLKNDAILADFRFDASLDNDLDKKQQSFIEVLDDYFSRPLRAEDELSYLATQYIAEAFSRRGLKGVVFKSSVSDSSGWNLAFFDAQAASVESSKLVEVSGITYSTKC